MVSYFHTTEYSSRFTLSVKHSRHGGTCQRHRLVPSSPPHPRSTRTRAAVFVSPECNQLIDSEYASVALQGSEGEWDRRGQSAATSVRSISSTVSFPQEQCPSRVGSMNLPSCLRALYAFPHSVQSTTVRSDMGCLLSSRSQIVASSQALQGDRHSVIRYPIMKYSSLQSPFGNCLGTYYVE